jgi:hypothetical protein
MSRIILMEPEPQRDAAPALTAPDLMFNIGRLSKNFTNYTAKNFLLFPFK